MSDKTNEQHQKELENLPASEVVTRNPLVRAELEQLKEYVGVRFDMYRALEQSGCEHGNLLLDKLKRGARRDLVVCEAWCGTNGVDGCDNHEFNDQTLKEFERLVNRANSLCDQVWEQGFSLHARELAKQEWQLSRLIASVITQESDAELRRFLSAQYASAQIYSEMLKAA